MKRIGAFVFVAFLGTTVMAYGGSFFVDSFNCANSVTVTGTGFNSSGIACAGSLGGDRIDGVLVFAGSSGPVSTLVSGAGSITGTMGSGQSGYDVMLWTGSTTSGVFNLPDLNLDGYSILVQIDSTTGGPST